MEKKLRLKVTADEQQTTTTMRRATKPKELTKLLRPKARYGDFILGQESKTGNSESHEKYKKKIKSHGRCDEKLKPKRRLELNLSMTFTCY